MTDIKEITKEIRTEVKKLGGKVSVSFESYSGGCSINIHVMQAPVRIIQRASEISPQAFWHAENHHYTKEQVIKNQSATHHQLNQHQLDIYNPNTWNNGVFITKAGFDYLKQIDDIIKQHHWDKSDISIDYFNCNFYYHIALGKWDKPFVDGIEPT